MNICVSNLSFGVDTEELKNQFSQYGKVVSVNIGTDNQGRQSRSFAYVEMPDRQEAEKAIVELNGFTLFGCTIMVNEARPGEVRPEKRSRFGSNRV